MRLSSSNVTNSVPRAPLNPLHCTRRPYMAPEVFLPGHLHNCIADYYSLGVTLFQLLCGQRPYPGSRQVLQGVVRMVSFVPPPSVTDPARIRRTLFSAQQRRAPLPELQFMSRLSRTSSACRAFVSALLVANPRYRLGNTGPDELFKHEWLSSLDIGAVEAYVLKSPLPVRPVATLAAAADSKLEAAWSLLAHKTHTSKPEAPSIMLPGLNFNIRDPACLLNHPELPASVPPDMPMQQMARFMGLHSTRQEATSSSTELQSPEVLQGFEKDSLKAESDADTAQAKRRPQKQRVTSLPSTETTSSSEPRKAMDVPHLAEQLRAFRDSSLAHLKGRFPKPARPRPGSFVSSAAEVQVVPEQLLLGSHKDVGGGVKRQVGVTGSSAAPVLHE